MCPDFPECITLLSVAVSLHSPLLAVAPALVPPVWRRGLTATPPCPVSPSRPAAATPRGYHAPSSHESERAHAAGMQGPGIPPAPRNVESTVPASSRKQRVCSGGGSERRGEKSDGSGLCRECRSTGYQPPPRLLSSVPDLNIDTRLSVCPVQLV